MPGRNRWDRKVYWIGPLAGSGGYAEEGRALAAAIRSAGFSVQEIDIPQPETFDQVSKMQEIGEVIADPDPSDIYIYHRYWPAPPLPYVGYHIWRTMFETSSVHPEWRRCAESYDAIWVPSQFNCETFAAGGIPVKKIQRLPCPIPTSHGSLVAKAHGLYTTNAKPYLFLSVMRWQQRKSWDMLVSAFLEEFGGDDDIHLVIKAAPFDRRNPDRPRQEFEAYASINGFGKPQNIEILTSELSIPEMISLYAAADAFVLASKGEGWGRPFIEAMLCGLPVIGPRWSANLEYMNDTNSLLVNGDLVDVSQKAIDEWRYFEGQSWFRPSIQSLRRCMRMVVHNDGPSAARRRQTIQELLENFSISNISTRARQLLLALP